MILKAILMTAFAANPIVNTNLAINNLTINNYDSINLETKIKKGQFLKETVIDTDENSLNTLLRSNYKIDTSEIEYEILTYNYAKIKPKAGSSVYRGYTYFSFKSEISPLLDKKPTANLVAHAYGSTQNKKDHIAFSYEATLGKTNFTEVFKKINFEWYAVTYNNAKKGLDGKRWHNPSNISGNVKKRYHGEDFEVLTNNKMERTELYSRVYSNVNSNSSYGYFEYSWKETYVNNEKRDILEIKFSVECNAYSSGWNPAWSKAENQLFLKNVKFN